MTKAKKTQGTRHFYGDSITLNDKQKKHIYELLGIEDKSVQENVTWLVQAYIGAYPDAVKSIDNKPRPANYLRDLQGDGYDNNGRLKNGLRKEAYDFSEKIMTLSGWMQTELKDQEYDVFNLAKELGRFAGACRKIEEKYEGKESRKGKPKKARQIIINHLKGHVFDRHNDWEDIEGDEYWDEHERSDIRKRKHREEQLLLFIRYCLKIGGIPCPKKDDQIIGLFYTDETPDNERIYLTKC